MSSARTPGLTSTGPHVPIVAMRRTSLLVVAAAYALSFLVVCLGTCVAAAPAAEHGCCGGQEGIRAVAVDCCSVTPGAAPHAPMAGAPPSTVALTTSLPEDLGFSWCRHPARPRLAASPSLVLRI